MGHPRPSLSGIGVPWVSLPGHHRCAFMPRVASKQSANPLWLLVCGLVNVSRRSSKQAQRGLTALLVYAFRIPCLTTILDSRSLECENTNTPARRVTLFCEHFVAPTAPAGCRSWMFLSMKSFVQQILINMLFISFEISSHLSCLLPAVPLSILFTPMQICFTLKRLLCFESCPELLRLGLRLVRRLLHLRYCSIDLLW